MKISLAITTYNRTKLVIESFIKVLNNDNIDDIVIVDDFSDLLLFGDLKKDLDELNNNKIKLFRNNINLKPFLNKYESVKRCKNDWVILLDSDNIVDNDYIEIVVKLDPNEEIIYCPDMCVLNNGYFHFNFFLDVLINADYCKEKLNFSNLSILLNTGNYFFNKNKYVSIINDNFYNYGDDKMISESGIDVMFFNYLWLKKKFSIKVIKNLKYFHRVHSGSWYLNNENNEKSREILEDMYKKLN